MDSIRDIIRRGAELEITLENMDNILIGVAYQTHNDVYHALMLSIAKSVKLRVISDVAIDLFEKSEKKY